MSIALRHIETLDVGESCVNNQVAFLRILCSIALSNGCMHISNVLECTKFYTQKQELLLVPINSTSSNFLIELHTILTEIYIAKKPTDST